MHSLIEIKKSLDRLNAEKQAALYRREITEKKQNKLQQLSIDLKDTQEIFQKASKLLYSALSIKLGNIITEGLRLVWPEEGFTFKIDFVERRNTIEADLYLEDTHGHVYSPLDATGGGVADLISLLLKITYITLSPCDNVLICDEPLKFIDENRLSIATKFVQTLCNNIGFQLIAVTHIPSLWDVSEKVYLTVKKNNVSKTKEI